MSENQLVQKVSGKSSVSSEVHNMEQRPGKRMIFCVHFHCLLGSSYRSLFSTESIYAMLGDEPWIWSTPSLGFFPEALSQ